VARVFLDSSFVLVIARNDIGEQEVRLAAATSGPVPGAAVKITDRANRIHASDDDCRPRGIG
jgi:hypothetical protein